MQIHELTSPNYGYILLYLRRHLLAKSKAVVKSHIWIAPLQCPVNINRRGLDPIRLEPSHSCTQKQVIIVQSTARIMQTLKCKQTNIKNQTYIIHITSDTLRNNLAHRYNDVNGTSQYYYVSLPIRMNWREEGGQRSADFSLSAFWKLDIPTLGWTKYLMNQ